MRHTSNAWLNRFRRKNIVSSFKQTFDVIWTKPGVIQCMRWGFYYVWSLNDLKSVFNVLIIDSVDTVVFFLNHLFSIKTSIDVSNVHLCPTEMTMNRKRHDSWSITFRYCLLKIHIYIKVIHPTHKLISSWDCHDINLRFEIQKNYLENFTHSDACSSI